MASRRGCSPKVCYTTTLSNRSVNGAAYVRTLHEKVFCFAGKILDSSSRSEAAGIEVDSGFLG